MRPLGSLVGVSKRRELFGLALVGICVTAFNVSFFSLDADLKLVWESANVVPPNMVGSNLEHVFKAFISTIVLLRSLLVHFFLATYVLLLWPVVFETRPALILPWLTVAAIKNILVAFLSIAAGLFMLYIHRTFDLEFLIAQAVQSGPQLYMWCLVLSYYRDLKKPTFVDQSFIDKMDDLEQRRAAMRKKTRTISKEHFVLEKTDLTIDAPSSEDDSMATATTASINLRDHDDEESQQHRQQAEPSAVEGSVEGAVEVTNALVRICSGRSLDTLLLHRDLEADRPPTFSPADKVACLLQQAKMDMVAAVELSAVLTPSDHQERLEKEIRNIETFSAEMAHQEARSEMGRPRVDVGCQACTLMTSWFMRQTSSTGSRQQRKPKTAPKDVVRRAEPPITPAVFTYLEDGFTRAYRQKMSPYINCPNT